MACKDNYAAHVSRITPHRRPVSGLFFGISAVRPPIRALTDSILRHNNNDVLGALVTRSRVPAGRDRKRSKTDALAEDGALDPAPEKVRDPKFREDGFFDPRDIVQVKYEMLRRASVEKASVTEVSEEYGVSRPTYYQAKSDFEEGGIAGLVPRSEVPAAPTRSGEVSAFLRAQISLVNRSGRANWRSRSRWSSASMSIHERSNGRSVQKKSRHDPDPGRSGRASDRRRRSLREASLGHAW